MTAVLENTVSTEATDAAPSLTIGVLELLTLLTNSLLFVSKDATLPVINAIRLETMGEHLTALATDRYRIGEFRFKATENTTDSFVFLLSAVDAKRWITTLKALPVLRGMQTRPIVLTLDGELGSVRLAWRDGLLNESSGTFQSVDGDFPRIRNLYNTAPAKQDGEIYSINPDFLADLGKLKDLTKGKVTRKGREDAIRFVPGATDNKPMNWLKGDWARGLLMLMRWDGMETRASEVLGEWL